MWTRFYVFSGMFSLILFKDIYWLTREFHRHKICLPMRSEIFVRIQPMGFLGRFSQCHLLSLRRESEPVKKLRAARGCQSPDRDSGKISGRKNYFSYLKVLSLWAPVKCYLTARMESYQRVCGSVRFAHLAPPIYSCSKLWMFEIFKIKLLNNKLKKWINK